MSAYTIIKRDARGQDILSYQGALVEMNEEYVCIDAEFALSDRDLGYVRLRRGDIFREWFYRGRWFNIFRVSDVQSSQVKGWYCNITRPAQFGVDWIAADDLCLDVFVSPAGRTLTLDEAEFATLNLTDEERTAAQKALRAIQAMVDKRAPPFDEITASTQKPN